MEEDLEDKTKRLAVYLGAQDSREPLAETVDYGTREKMPMVEPEVRRHNFEADRTGLHAGAVQERSGPLPEVP